jgi:pimeloyl-ACP methyl ester carboxylesterase
LLVDYHDILSTTIGREPRTWQRGPISQSIADLVANEMDYRRVDQHYTTSEEESSTIVLVTFSMGAAMGLKLVQEDAKSLLPDDNNANISSLVLIEPVWRCWLSLAPRDRPIAEIPTLAVWGTNDRDTLTDSGKSVPRSLRPLLSNLTTKSLEGANHWYILNDNVSVSLWGLPQGHTRRATQVLRDELIQCIAEFCQTKEGE